MKRKYDPGFAPPAPMIDVALGAGRGAAMRTARAKIDSGADLCAVPRDLVEPAGLHPERMVRAAGFLGDLTEVPVYRMDLEVDGRRLDGVEALVTRRPYVILGRNVLRHFVARLDGPAETLTLTRPRPRSGRR